MPLHVPEHIALLTIIPVPPIALQVPVHMPSQVPSQWTVGAVPGVHVPVQSAWHEPWQLAATATDPSHVAIALQVPLHCTLRSPG